MAATPCRIQRRRTKGWRMPEGVMYVGRPTRWGNPWRVGEEVEVRISGSMDGASAGEYDPTDVRFFDLPMPGITQLTAELAVVLYRNDLLANLQSRDPYYDDLRQALLTLAGLDLCCWCPLDQPCHADVLLEAVNR